MTFVEEDNLTASTGLRVRTSQAPAGSALHPSSSEPSREDRDSWEIIYNLKVTPCPREGVHNWSVCPYAHEGEKAARRDPRTHAYTAIACLQMKQEGRCSHGDACKYAHSAWEYWLHPTRYHTTMCNLGAACTRKFCFFAHHPSELRVPAERPRVPSKAGRGKAGRATCGPLKLPLRLHSESEPTAVAAVAQPAQRAQQGQQAAQQQGAASPTHVAYSPFGGSSAASDWSGSASGWLEGQGQGQGQGLEQGLTGGLGSANSSLFLDPPVAGLAATAVAAAAALGAGPAQAGLELAAAAAAGVGSALCPTAPFYGLQAGTWAPPASLPPPSSSSALAATSLLDPSERGPPGLRTSFQAASAQEAPAVAGIDEQISALVEAVSAGLALGRLNADQACSLLGRLLPPQAMLALSQVLGAQAQAAQMLQGPPLTAAEAEALNWAQQAQQQQQAAAQGVPALWVPTLAQPAPAQPAGFDQLTAGGVLPWLGSYGPL